MVKRLRIIIFAIFSSLLVSSSPIAYGESTDIAISSDTYSYQPIPPDVFFGHETTVGFHSGGIYIGKVTTKGPDNVWATVFDPCSEKIINYCIESVAYKKFNTSKWILGSITDWKPADNDPRFTETTYTQRGETQYRDYFIHPDTGLPRGGYAKVWNLPGATHGGGDSYLVGAGVDYYKNVNPDKVSQVFLIGIAPVKLGKSIVKPQGIWPFNYGERYNFPSEIELQVKIRMGDFASAVGSWFNGRILDPKIRIENSTITLAGTPTRVLAARTGLISCENRPLIAMYREMCLKRNPSLAGSRGSTGIPPSIEAATNPSELFPKGIFAYFEPLLKPVGFTSEWNGLTWGVTGSGSCQISPGKIAIVSSNATLYSVFPPAWDENEQTLSYRVGSLHLDHKGEIHRGHFNLAVPRDFAECLWGNNLSGARASVSITNVDGTKNIATSSLTQDDQMVYFKVAGFTFSTPQIKVKLETAKPVPTPTPVTTPSAKPIAKKITINCIKGKTSKKVTAVTPKCPSGYKKK